MHLDTTDMNRLSIMGVGLLVGLELQHHTLESECDWRLDGMLKFRRVQHAEAGSARAD